jgi:hypothetical protein
MTTRTHGRMIQTGSVGPTNLAAGAVNRAAVRRFTSDWLTWDAGDTLTIPHGLGVEPWHVQLYLQATSPDEGGWEALDVFAWDAPIWRANATNVTVLIGSATQTALNKDTGASFNLTPALWLIRAVAHG